MSEYTDSVSRVAKAVLWLISAYVSAVTVMLLAFVMITPIAWLAAVLDIPDQAYLALAVVPLLVLSYLVQRRRIGERLATKLSSRLFFRTIDIAESRQLRQVDETWREIWQLAQERARDWANLYNLVRRVRKEVSQCENSIALREEVCRRLHSWTAASGPRPATLEEIDKALDEVKSLQSQIRSSYDRIDELNDQIVKKSILLLEKGIESKLRDTQLAVLVGKLEFSEKQLTRTLLTRLEHLWRHQWREAQERSLERMRRYVTDWLDDPFDMDLAMQDQRKLLAVFENGRRIFCKNGASSEISLAPSDWTYTSLTRLNAEQVDELGDL